MRMITLFQSINNFINRLYYISFKKKLKMEKKFTVKRASISIWYVCVSVRVDVSLKVYLPACLPRRD